MRLLLPLLLLTLPVHTEELPPELPYCDQVGVELLIAQQEGYITLTDDEIAAIIRRCLEIGV